MISVQVNVISSIKYICLFLSKIQLPDVICQNFKFSDCVLNEEHALLMCCNLLKLGGIRVTQTCAQASVQQDLKEWAI